MGAKGKPQQGFPLLSGLGICGIILFHLKMIIKMGCFTKTHEENTKSHEGFKWMNVAQTIYMSSLRDFIIHVNIISPKINFGATKCVVPTELYRVNRV